MRVRITSCGVLHATPPAGDIVKDLQNRFQDPNLSERLRHMNGLDPEIIENVMSQPGAREFVDELCDEVEQKAALQGDVDVTLICRGGKHRSVATGEEAAAKLSARGFDVQVVHRDIDGPLLERSRGAR